MRCANRPARGSAPRVLRPAVVRAGVQNDSSQPFAGLPSQLANPSWHRIITHTALSSNGTQLESALRITSEQALLAPSSIWPSQSSSMALQTSAVGTQGPVPAPPLPPLPAEVPEVPLPLAPVSFCSSSSPL